MQNGRRHHSGGRGSYPEGRLIASPLDTFSIDVRLFIGLVGEAMGGLGSLAFLLLHHLVWQSEIKWKTPGWSDGLLLPWQWVHFFAMTLLSMSVGEWFIFLLKYGWRESTQPFVFFGMGLGMWLGVRLGMVISKSTVPPPPGKGYLHGVQTSSAWCTRLRLSEFSSHLRPSI
jgi:hypothetical protein